MYAIPFVTSDLDLVGRAEHAVRAVGGETTWPSLTACAPDTALERLRVELPELFVVDLSDTRVPTEALMDAIRSDPWLMDGGIVAICRPEEVEEKKAEAAAANYLAVLPRDRMDVLFPRVLGIVLENRRLLLQRVIGRELVPNVGGTFRIENDPAEAYCHQGLLVNFLFNTNRIDAETKTALSFSLQEMLLNAIEHGNCGITYEEKSSWLDRGRPILELVAARNEDPVIADRRVVLEYCIDPDRSRFRIADEGEGFDWRQARDVSQMEALMRAHGRGIAMTKAVTENLRWNEKGNEVCFDVPHQLDETSATPGLLANIAPRDIEADEVVFREGDPGDFLYFIVRGRYEVLVGERKVAELTPEDLFLGEMAFLLHAPRSATVRARTSGRLIEVSKDRFVDAIREHPHYALLLSRLLAQRIQRMDEGLTSA